MEMDGMKAIQKDRILQVNQGEICWVVGTLYLSMHLKPDVLQDLTREVSMDISIED